MEEDKKDLQGVSKEEEQVNIANAGMEEQRPEEHLKEMNPENQNPEEQSLNEETSQQENGKSGNKIKKKREKRQKPPKLPKPPKKKKKGSKKKIIFFLLLLLIILAGVAVGLQSCGGEPVLFVSAEPVSRMDIKEEVSIKGKVEGSETANVVSALNNTITKINVKEGDRVKKGQVLAVLDGKDLQAAYNQAASQYQQSKYALEDTLKTQQSQYEAALISYNEAKNNYEINKSLYEEGAISQSDFLKFENDYLLKQADINSYHVSGGKVTATAAQRQALEVERLALESKKEALEDIKIKSPISGTVTRANATLGRLASETGDSGNVMFVIENVDNLEMNVMIGEYDINKLKIGQPVTISSEVLGEDTVSGVVSQISPTGEEQESGGNVQMAIPVKIKITESHPNLIAGVMAKAVILVNEAPDALAIPIDALLEDVTTGETYVLVVDENSVLQRCVVELGLEGDFYSEVTGGELSEGDSVVLNAGISGLSEGMIVTVQ